MMEPVAVPSPSPALLADDVRAPLPGLMMGDEAADAPRRHEWPGKLFIALSYLGAFGLGMGMLGAVMMAVDIGSGMMAQAWARLLGGAAWALLQWRLAGEVRRFSRWGWYGAMAELGGAAAIKVGVVATMPVMGLFYVPMLAANFLWMRYFWKRRAQFGVDINL